MTRKDVTKYAPLSGVLTVVAVLVADFTRLLNFAPWEVAVAFPAGAFGYLFIEFLSEKAGPA